MNALPSCVVSSSARATQQAPAPVRSAHRRPHPSSARSSTASFQPEPRVQQISDPLLQASPHRSTWPVLDGAFQAVGIGEAADGKGGRHPGQQQQQLSRVSGHGDDHCHGRGIGAGSGSKASSISRTVAPRPRSMWAMTRSRRMQDALRIRSALPDGGCRCARPAAPVPGVVAADFQQRLSARDHHHQPPILQHQPVAVAQSLAHARGRAGTQSPAAA